MSVTTTEAPEAFELGFLQRCADEGLSAHQTQVRIKLASTMLRKEAGGLSDLWQQFSSKNTVPQGQPGAGQMDARTLALLGGLGVAGTLGVGAGIGHLVHKLKGNFVDEDDVKKQERINQYRMLTRQMGAGQI